MTDPRNEYEPQTVSPPGETLQDILEEREMTPRELARRCEVGCEVIGRILEGKAPITPDTASVLEAALQVPARFWLAREARYREWLARRPCVEDLT